MARIRSVKPSLRTSRVVAQWRHDVRYFWVLLWGYLDDEGRGLDLPRAIAADCYPLEDNMTATKIDRWLKLIATTRRDPDRDPPLCRYQVGEHRYLHAVYWDDNQRPNRPTPSRIPPCPIHERLNGHSPPSRSEPLTESPLSDSLGEVGKKGGGRREGEGASAEPVTEPADPGPPQQHPPPAKSCPKHPDGTDAPCRACQRARQAWETWDAARRERVAKAPKCRKHRGQLARNCPLCRSERLADKGDADAR